MTYGVFLVLATLQAGAALPLTRLDLAAEVPVWRRVATDEHVEGVSRPTPRRAPACFAVADRYLLVFGGDTREGESDELHCLDLAAGRTAPEELLGTGILALTIDQGVHMQRYQGIVELDGSSLEVVAQKYFRQSEQIPTAVRLAAGQQILSGNRTQWRAGGIVAQFLPDAPERMRMPDLHGGDGDDGSGHAPVDNAWRETEALLATIEPSNRP